MLTQFIFVFAVVVVMLAILGLFIFKAGIQLKYLRIKAKKPAGSTTDIIQFDYSNAKERQERIKAFLLFPMFYPTDTDDDESENLQALRRKVSRIHIAIYTLLMIIIILAISSEKIFPQSA